MNSIVRPWLQLSSFARLCEFRAAPGPGKEAKTTHAYACSHVLGRTNSILLPSGLICPCDASVNIRYPSFMGEDYFCESGNSERWNGVLDFYSNDIMWDGEDCRLLLHLRVMKYAESANFLNI